MNHRKYLEKILETLEKKYGKAFEAVRLNYEVDGTHGNFYRAVCKEKGGSETFLAAYYFNGSDYLLSDFVERDAELPGSEAVLVDEYPNMLLNGMAADYLIGSDPNILYAFTDIRVGGYAFSMDDLAQGVTFCLSHKGLETQARIYLFVNEEVKNREQFEEEIISKTLALNIYKQSIDFAYVSGQVIEEVRETYATERYMLEDRLEEDIRVSRYSWYFVERGQEIRERKVVKEG